MKKVFLNFALLITMFVVSSCIDEWDCERGEGPIISQEIILPEFDSFTLNGSGTVYLTEGEEQEVIVEGQANIIDLLKTRVFNGNWEIEFSDCVKSHEDLKFFITLPVTTGLSVNGSGKIVSQNVLNGDRIKVRVNGSGDLDLAVDIEDVKSTITGSGKIYLEGFTATSDMKITGSGKIHAFDLLSAAAEVDISGSGDAEVNVLEDLDVRISGSGEVRFKGNPSVDANISGSGKVVKVNN